MSSIASVFFSRPILVFGAAALLRVILLVYGRWQDTHSAMKYTDIDYIVFTDAARFISHGQSPYARATYRYTPLLAWLLHPTTWEIGGLPWFDFGKALFASGDIVTGWLISCILRKQQNMSANRAMQYASIWLLNPMVANISTRGSSEGLVAVTVVALLWAVLERRVRLAGLLLGFGVHLKIYPFIYAASIFWWLGDNITDVWRRDGRSAKAVRAFLSPDRLLLARESFISFMALNTIMYAMYVLILHDGYDEQLTDNMKLRHAICRAHLSLPCRQNGSQAQFLDLQHRPPS